MGCDIHCYMEYRPRPAPNVDASPWQSFGDQINPGRDYDMFARLAGVRGPTDAAVYAPRGAAPGMGYAARVDYGVNVWAGKAADKPETWCTPADAAKWVAGGESTWLNDEHTTVSAPDWHSASWLTTGEYLAVLFQAEAQGCKPDPEYWAIWAALASFESRGYEARLVFWFDN